MLAGPDHVHQIEARIPPLRSSPAADRGRSGSARDSATAKVYSSLQPMELLGALTQSPAPLSKAKSTSPPNKSSNQQVHSSNNGYAVTGVSSAATARLIDELQYAVRVHSESAMRLNEQLLASQRDLAEVTDVLTAENRKVTNRTLELEEQLRAKELQRQEQVQNSISSIHQHFTAFEHEREARREEVESLQKLIKAVTQEKEIFSQRNEELSRTLHQRDEEWAADLEHFTAQIKKSQHTTLQLEGRVAELTAVQSDNNRLTAELTIARPIAEREPLLLDEIEKLRQQVDALQSHLVSANASVISLQKNVADGQRDVSGLRHELAVKDAQLHEILERNATRPSEAQLHAKIREVVAHNQRLVHLIKQPSGAVSHGAYSPTMPPGVRGVSPYREHSSEVSHSHWNESVQRAASYDHGKSAMERMYPPADSMTEPTTQRDDRPSVPRLSQRPVREEPKVVTRQEVRRESVRAWADETAPTTFVVAQNNSRTPAAAAPTRNLSPTAGSPQARASRSKSLGDLRNTSPPNQSGSLQNTRGSMRGLDAAGRPMVPQHRASVSLSRSPSHREGSLGSAELQSLQLQIQQQQQQQQQQQPVVPRRASVRLPTPTEDAPQEAAAPRVPLSRGAQSMRQPSPLNAATTPQEYRSVRSVGDMRPRQDDAVPRREQPPVVVVDQSHQPSSGSAFRSRDSGGEVEHYANTTPRGSVAAAQLQQQQQQDQQSQIIQYPQQTRVEPHQPQSAPLHDDIVVEFEDDPIVTHHPPHQVNTSVLPPHAQSSFIPSIGGEPAVVIIENQEPTSLVAEVASSTASPALTRGAGDGGSSRGAVVARLASGSRLVDNKPRQNPEIDAEGVSFSRAKSTFVNSMPLTGPSSPYVAPMRKAQSSGGMSRGPPVDVDTTLPPSPPHNLAPAPPPPHQHEEEYHLRAPLVEDSYDTQPPHHDDEHDGVPPHLQAYVSDVPDEYEVEAPFTAPPPPPPPPVVPTIPIIHHQTNAPLPHREPTPRNTTPRTGTPTLPPRAIPSPRDVTAVGNASISSARDAETSAPPPAGPPNSGRRPPSTIPFTKSPSRASSAEREHVVVSSTPSSARPHGPTSTPFAHAAPPQSQDDNGRRSPGIAKSLLETPRRPHNTHQVGDELSEPLAEGSITPEPIEVLSPRLDSSQGFELPLKYPSYDANGVSAERFGTVGEMLIEAAASGNARSVAVFHNANEQVSLSWKKYAKTAKTFSKALIGDAATSGTRVAFLGDNSAEFSVAYLGTMMCGAVAAVVNPKLAEAEWRRQVNQVAPRILMVDSPKTLNTCILNRSKLPTVRRMVVAHGVIPPRVKEAYQDLVFTFDEYLEKARFASANVVAEREASVTTGTCAVIAFTSGATQQALPVMISHDNLLFSAWALAHAIQIKRLTQADGNVRIASCSSLADVVFQVTDVILPLVTSAKLGVNVTTYYSRGASSSPKDAVALLQSTNPTFFIGSAQLWQSLFPLALSNVNASPIDALGLAEAKLLLWGGSDWSLASRSQVFDRLGFEAYQYYSLTETTGIATTSSITTHDYASVGASLPGTELRTVHDEIRDYNTEYGDIELYGRNVAMGYLNYPTMTEEYFTQDGFFRTSDVGKKDPDDLVYIKGRTWDFIQNSKSESVSLRTVEDALQAGCKAASRIVVVGSNRPSLICLIALKTIRDANGRPTGDLADEATNINPNLRTIAEARADEQVRLHISGVIREYNNGLFCPSAAHKVKQFIFFRTEPSYEEDLITLNGKLRRSMILEKYSAEIDNAYDQKPRKPTKRETSVRSPIEGTEDHQ
ncbi:AMP-binding protein, putative [Bodo saltans]|uniref:AMP-binding protein, putative n=1 Tax=Bodo saltans TaxID=75058 RepID=A0A0S4JM16_BODSA|nr:AMP-binding protein, putative [Bodo saltans]|eukprot:CUG90317.1 AMP-binding protein, putative [Bodo saltans]